MSDTGKGSGKKRPITEVPDDEAMARLFSKKVVKDLKKIADEAKPKKPDTKK